MQAKVPDYAAVPKAEYQRLRNECQRTARAAAFDWTDLWNLAVREVEKRHANVLKGRAKNELPLAEAVLKIQREAVKARMDIESEKAQALSA